MKKLILFFLIILNLPVFSIIENNYYGDQGLNEKNGTYGFDAYLRKSSFMFYTGVGKGNFSEVGFRLKLFLDLPELQGFFFNGNIFVSRSSLAIITSGDISWWGSFVPFFGDTHLGYKNKYVTFKVGFQNLISSDAIYNHLLIDDYSGSLFAIKINSMLGRFVDIEFSYCMIRPHQGPWYQGGSLIATPDTTKDKTLYYAYYGKSLYTHKLNIRPLPWIRFGIYEGAYFMGENLNPWYANPFFIFIVAQALDSLIQQKDGSKYNMHAVNLLAGLDFNIGFNGWRVYGEVLLDDFNGEYVRFQDPSHPDKFAFILGGELRGYLFTKKIKLSKAAEFFINNLYFNVEYGIVSKYTYSRDSNFNYEYVRAEYPYRYDTLPPTEDEINTVNRVGNFLGFMYGPNSDCLDIAIGWRNDLWNVKEYAADYQGDIYFQSFKKKQYPNKLFKTQLHFRQYRLGDERDVTRPYYYNEHYFYDLETGESKDNLGTSRGTDFLSKVLEIGHILDLNIYGDIVRISRFVFGMETKFNFFWQTLYPFTPEQITSFNFRWDFGITITW